MDLSNYYIAFAQALTNKTIEESQSEKILFEHALSLKEYAEAHADEDNKSQILMDASRAMFLSGHYARAELLIKSIDVTKINKVSIWCNLLIQREFTTLFAEARELLDEITDELIADAIDKRTFTPPLQMSEEIEDRAINLVILRTIASALIHLEKCLEEGDIDAGNGSIHLLTKANKLTLASQHFDLRWNIISLQWVIKELIEHSLWRLLEDWIKEDKQQAFVHGYIRGCYTRKMPMLWKSQRLALPKVGDPERRSFVLSLPTSAGKTHIGELAILRFLLDSKGDNTIKCVYITPLRSLALQIERDFYDAFGFLGDQSIFISSFYGSNELDVLDAEFLSEAKIIVVTPEKLDSLIRQSPSLLKQIRLVIADEGHEIADDFPLEKWKESQRSWRYRALLERLILALMTDKKRDERNGARILLVSGVINDAKSLSTWLSGTPDSIVDIDWRPVPLPSIDSLIFEKGRFHKGKNTKPISFPALPGLPSSMEGALFYLSLWWANECSSSMLMIFSSSKKKIKHQTFTSTWLKLLQVWAPWGSPNLTDVNDIDKLSHEESVSLLLDSGIAIHHADLCPSSRKKVEQYINKGKVHVICATPTLDQGINLPIHKTIIYSLYSQPDIYRGAMAPRKFWNLIARTGRALSQTSEHQKVSAEVWCVINADKKTQKYHIPNLVQSYTNTKNKLNVINRFLSVLLEIKRSWIEQNHSADLSKLLHSIAEGNFQWVKDSQTRDMYDKWLWAFSDHLNDLSFTAKFLAMSPTDDCLEAVTDRLMAILTNATEITQADFEFVRSAVGQVATFTKKIPEDQRMREYMLGLPKSNRDLIFDSKEKLLDDYLKCEMIFRKETKPGIQALTQLIVFMLNLPFYHSKKKSKWEVACNKLNSFTELINSWLNGESDAKFDNLFSKVFGHKKSALSFREDVLEGTLPWIIGSVARVLEDSANAGGKALSNDLQYLPSFIKYGTSSVLGCWLIKIGISRSGAAKLSKTLSQKDVVVNMPSDPLIYIVNSYHDAVKLVSAIPESTMKDIQLDTADLDTLSRYLKPQDTNQMSSEPPPNFYPNESLETYQSEYSKYDDLDADTYNC